MRLKDTKNQIWKNVQVLSEWVWILIFFFLLQNAALCRSAMNPWRGELFVFPLFPVLKPSDNTANSKILNLFLVLSTVLQLFGISHKAFLQVGILPWGRINWSKFQFPISNVQDHCCISVLSYDTVYHWCHFFLPLANFLSLVLWFFYGAEIWAWTFEYTTIHPGQTGFGYQSFHSKKVVGSWCKFAYPNPNSIELYINH